MTIRARLQRWLTPVAVAAVLLPGCGDPVDESADSTFPPAATVTDVTPTVTTTEPATTSSAAPPVADPAVDDWVRVGDSPAVLGGEGSQEMNAVVAWDGGFVAVGGDGDDPARDAAVWVSDDGVQWLRIVDPDGLNTDGLQTMNAVAVGGPGVVAVGTSSPGVHKDDAAVWTSVDGRRWLSVPDDSAVFTGAGDHQMLDVVAGGPGFVAVGLVGSVDSIDAAVWTSPDGLVWSRVPHDDTTFGGDGHQFISGIVAGAFGLVAVGGDGSGGDLDAAVWLSSDALMWSRAADVDGSLDGSGDQVMAGIAAGGPGVVAVGRDKPGSDIDGAVWISDDGAAWSRVDDASALGGPGDQAISRIVGEGGRLVAVGYERTDDRNAQVWTSSDGVTWTASSDPGLVAPGLQELNGVASDSARIVAVGYSGDLADKDAAVWHHSN